MVSKSVKISLAIACFGEFSFFLLPHILGFLSLAPYVVCCWASVLLGYTTDLFLYEGEQPHLKFSLMRIGINTLAWSSTFLMFFKLKKKVKSSETSQ